jgi:hypothetical protein
MTASSPILLVRIKSLIDLSIPNINKIMLVGMKIFKGLKNNDIFIINDMKPKKFDGFIEDLPFLL